ncbi:hypothetical protein BGW80DRAFT_1250287 [Lactifluus volemus]|nr:hypothetical protein BGW80DRAFT_1250287 [Lactifluus volemus]
MPPLRKSSARATRAPVAPANPEHRTPGQAWQRTLLCCNISLLLEISIGFTVRRRVWSNSGGKSNVSVAPFPSPFHELIEGLCFWQSLIAQDLHAKVVRHLGRKTRPCGHRVA